MSPVDRNKQQTSFSINSWPALQSLLSIAVMLFGGVAWGLKLESRIDMIAREHQEMHRQTEHAMTTIQEQLQRGILPITAVRIESLEEKIKNLSANLDECLKKQ